MLHGTYKTDDVTFLLKVIDIKETDTLNKEKLIQSGQKHYSQMLSVEKPPSREYLEVFYQAFELNKNRFAKDIVNLALLINKTDNPVIVSLARAGTPIGVLLKRIFRDILGKEINHYSVSIIRDKGLDLNALDYIYKNNPDSNIIFVDGWTGKGVISKQLKKSVKEFNLKNNSNISDLLYVVSDISGMADFSSTDQDYLIPSAVLNSTVSGLISRTITGVEGLDVHDFHGCKFYDFLISSDLSLWFIDEIMNTINNLNIKTLDSYLLSDKNYLKEKSLAFIKEMMKEFNINNINYIKPGLGETTRVLLRRVPERILVQDINSEEVKHLVVLAKEKNCPIIEFKAMPYKAVGIIATVD